MYYPFLVCLSLDLTVAFDEDAHKTVVGVIGELLMLRSAEREVANFECFGVDGPGQDTRLIFELAHGQNCFWLFYALITLEVSQR
jgi:hypothetical protein